MRSLLLLALILFAQSALFAQRIDEDKQGTLDQMVELISENLEVENIDFFL